AGALTCGVARSSDGGISAPPTGPRRPRRGLGTGQAPFSPPPPHPPPGATGRPAPAPPAGPPACSRAGAGAARRRPGLGPAEERARGLTAMAADLGWGTLTVETLTPTSLVVIGSNSPFPAAHAATGDPVCHLTRGVLEALAENLFGRRVPVHETHCEATGAS